jgi:hypothetical protein
MSTITYPAAPYKGLDTYLQHHFTEKISLSNVKTRFETKVCVAQTLK